MYYILHQHYESVLRLTKIVSPNQLDEFYSIFNNSSFLKLNPQARLKFLQKALPIPDSKHFTLENFNKVAEQTVEEMVQQNISHIDLRISLRLERWKDVFDICHARNIYDNALAKYVNKTIFFIAALDMTKSEEEIERSMKILFKEKTLKSIVGVDITMYEEDILKFNKYYKTLLKLRSEYKKMISMHLGEFTANYINFEIIRKMKPNRIAHGIALLESPELCEFIKHNNICLDVCPVSNKVLGVVDWGKYNPIEKAINLSIPVTINTDDPIMFNTNISKEIKTANLSRQQLNLLIENSKKYVAKNI
jgi:adenosine deaminase